MLSSLLKEILRELRHGLMLLRLFFSLHYFWLRPCIHQCFNVILCSRSEGNSGIFIYTKIRFGTSCLGLYGGWDCGARTAMY